MQSLVITRKELDRKLLEVCGIGMLFLYIYSPSLKFFPVNISYVIMLLAFAYSAMGNNLGRFAAVISHKAMGSYLFFYAFILLYVAIIPLLSNGAYDSSFLITYIRLLLDIILIIPFFVLIFRYELNYSFRDFLEAIVTIGVIQGVIATLMFVVPGLRELVFTYIMNAPSDKLARELYRGYGLANDYYFAVPLFQALVFIVNSVLYIHTNKRKYLFFYPFILLSMVMNARITIVAIPVFFMVIFVLSFYYDNLKWIRRMSALFFILSTLMLLITVYFLFNPEKAETILWILEGVIGGIGALGGDLSESKTLTTIAKEHFHFPNYSFELWFGQGINIFGNPASVVRSDLGYIRYIYFGGILLSLISYFALINFSVSRVLNIPDVLIKSLLISLLITLFIVHLKGDILNSSAFLKGYFLLLIFSVYDRTKSLHSG